MSFDFLFPPDRFPTKQFSQQDISLQTNFPTGQFPTKQFSQQDNLPQCCFPTTKIFHRTVYLCSRFFQTKPFTLNKNVNNVHLQPKLEKFALEMDM